MKQIIVILLALFVVVGCVQGGMLEQLGEEVSAQQEEAEVRATVETEILATREAQQPEAPELQPGADHETGDEEPGIVGQVAELVQEGTPTPEDPIAQAELQIKAQATQEAIRAAEATVEQAVYLTAVANVTAEAEAGKGFLGVATTNQVTLQGEYVTAIVMDSSAHHADIRVGDLIMRIDGVLLGQNGRRLVDVMQEKTTGNQIEIIVQRNLLQRVPVEELTKYVTLISKPEGELVQVKATPTRFPEETVIAAANAAATAKAESIEAATKVAVATEAAQAEGNIIGVGEEYEFYLDAERGCCATPEKWLEAGGHYVITASGTYQPLDTHGWYGPEGEIANTAVGPEQRFNLEVNLGQQAEMVGRKLEVTPSETVKPKFWFSTHSSSSKGGFTINIKRLEPEEAEALKAEATAAEESAQAAATATMIASDAEAMKVGETATIEVFANQQWQAFRGWITPDGGSYEITAEGLWNHGEGGPDFNHHGVNERIDGLVRNGTWGKLVLRVVDENGEEKLHGIDYGVTFNFVKGSRIRFLFAMNDYVDRYNDNTGKITVTIKRHS